MASKKTQRSPVHLSLRHGHQTHRDAIWAAIRELKRFTINDVEHWVNHQKTRSEDTVKNFCSRDTVKTYIQGLQLAGYLHRIEGQRRDTDASGRYQQSRWELVNDIGIDAPRVTRDGKEVTQGKGRQQMWKAMKILKDFNWRELIAHASTESTKVKDEEAKDYIKYLLRANYLVKVQEQRPHQLARYRLLPARYTGPKAPMIQRIKQVFDPNIGEVVWPRSES